MDNYTPRYDRGAPSDVDPSTVADPDGIYTATITSTPSSNIGYQRLDFLPPDYDPSNPVTQRMLPLASHVSVFAYVYNSIQADEWDSSVEMVLAPYDAGDTPTVIPGSAAIAWLWGEGFSFAEAFRRISGSFGDDPRWVMTMSGPLSRWALYVKTGMTVGSAVGASTTIEVQVRLIADGHPSRDRINPVCTVPPFDPSGDYLFARDNDVPAKQTAQCQREWFGRAIALLQPSATYAINVFGGPWIGQMSFWTETSAIQADSMDMDASIVAGVPSGVGFVIDTITTTVGQVSIPEPQRIEYQQFAIANGLDQQFGNIRIALTSPTV